MTGPAQSRAQSAWGDAPPDWVIALARACDGSSQAAIAKRLKYSGTVVSQTLSNTYGGRLDQVEDAVRAHIMGLEVDCPTLGRIGLASCKDWRAKARDFSGHNAQRVMMRRACSRCPRFQAEEVQDA